MAADIRDLARQRIEARQRAQRITGGVAAVPPLMEFISRTTPGYEKPLHLSPVLDRLAGSDVDRIDDCGSCPPRHGKTESLLHYIVWSLLRNPRDQLAYFTYNLQQAIRKQKDALDMAHRAGLRLSQENATEWRTPEGGKVYWGSVDGSFTGVGVRILIVDDPHKDRKEAESATIRNAIWQWFTDTAYSRIEPGGSCLVNMARWHPEDLIGKLSDVRAAKEFLEDRGTKFELINLPAIRVVNGVETALWPQRWPLSELARKRWNDYTWASLYMGSPRSKGGALFKEAQLYKRASLASEGYRWGMGLDFAYTAKTYSDYNIILCGLRYGEGDQAKLYLDNMVRKQCRFAEFLPLIKAEYDQRPGAVVRAYIGGGAEVAVGEMVSEELPVPAEIISVTADKFVRAQPASTNWNAGRILLPDDPGDAEWVNELLPEILNFTGVDDTHDDVVDGLAALNDALLHDGDFYDGLDIRGRLTPRRM